MKTYNLVKSVACGVEKLFDNISHYLGFIEMGSNDGAEWCLEEIEKDVQDIKYLINGNEHLLNSDEAEMVKKEMELTFQLTMGLLEMHANDVVNKYGKEEAKILVKPLFELLDKYDVDDEIISHF